MFPRSPKSAWQTDSSPETSCAYALQKFCSAGVFHLQQPPESGVEVGPPSGKYAMPVDNRGSGACHSRRHGSIQSERSGTHLSTDYGNTRNRSFAPAVGVAAVSVRAMGTVGTVQGEDDGETGVTMQYRVQVGFRVNPTVGGKFTGSGDTGTG